MARDDELFAHLLLTLGLVRREEVQECLAAEEDGRLGERLVRRGVLDFANLERAILARGSARRCACPVCGTEVLVPSGSTEVPCLRPDCPGRPDELETGLEGVPGRIGNYDVLDLLGRGGMGAVYRARDRTLDRTVALKLVPRGRDSATVERFRREARAAARLSHPCIVPVYDVGEEGPWLYVALKLIDGADLAGTKLPAARAIEVLGLVAGAVDEAHRRGIVHRDLKPGNILLDRSGTPFVTDFGLARFVEASNSVTQSGSILGSPSYMAPEQARGEIDQLGPASDVYSLGATLYNLLTGLPPFEGATVLAVLERVRSGDFEAPRAIDPSIPPEVEAVCLRAMALEPSARYPTAAALAEDCRRLLAGAQRPTRRSSSDRSPRRRRRLVLGGAATLVVALVAAGGAALLSGSWGPAGVPSGQAEPFERLEEVEAELPVPAVRDSGGTLVVSIATPRPDLVERVGSIEARLDEADLRLARALAALAEDRPGDALQEVAGAGSDGLAARIAAHALHRLGRGAEAIDRLGESAPSVLRARILVALALEDGRSGRDPATRLAEVRETGGALGPLLEAEALLVEAGHVRSRGGDPRLPLDRALRCVGGSAGVEAARVRGDALTDLAVFEEERSLLDPRDPGTLDRAIDAYAAGGEDAEAWLRQAEALRLRWIWGHGAGGGDRTDLETASNLARGVLELAPGSVGAAILLAETGGLAARTSDPDADSRALAGIVESLGDVVRRYPDSVLPLLARASWRLELFRVVRSRSQELLPLLEEIDRDLTRALEIDPRNVATWIERARVRSLVLRTRLDGGEDLPLDFEPALGDLRLAAAVDAGDARVDLAIAVVQRDRARYLRARGRPAEAAQAVDEAIERFGRSVGRTPAGERALQVRATLWRDEALAAFAAGEDPLPAAEEARRDLADAVRLSPRDASAWNSLADMSVREAHWTKQAGRAPGPILDCGLAAALEATHLAPGEAVHWETLASVRLDRVNLGIDPRSKAASVLEAGERAIALDPDRFEIRVYVAYALLQLDRGAEALPHLDRASALSPARARKELGGLYAEARRQAEGNR